MARLCSKKRTTPGCGIALCRKTCQRLWEAIPDSYRAGHGFTDFWAAYQAVIPQEQHTPVGKETGETAHAGVLEEHGSGSVWLVLSA